MICGTVRNAKVFLVAILLFMVFTLIPTAFARADDIANHWAGKQINAWSSQGLIGGYPDGTFRPESSITRAEFFALINRVFAYKNVAKVSFSDVSATDWYHDEIAKTVAAGYSEGYPDGTMKPNAYITRQEAAVAISRAFALDTSRCGNIPVFSDSDYVADWASGAVGALSGRKVIRGYPDGSFGPKRNIKRAEAVVMLQNACGVMYTDPGTYSSDAQNNVVVNASGITLENMTIAGDLYLAQGVGDGIVTLDRVTVEGTTFIWGGGENSIILRNSRLRNLLIDKNGETNVRIVAEGNTIVFGTMTINSGSKIETTGTSLGATPFERLEISAHVPPESIVRLLGVFGDVIIAAPTGHVEIGTGRIGNVTVRSTATVNIAQGALIDRIVIGESAKGARITASAAIRVEVNAENVTVNNQAFSSGDNVRVPEGGGAAIKIRTRSLLDDNDEDEPTLVSDIDVTGAGGLTAVLNGSSLQMNASVLPENADDKRLTWSVEDGTGSATISQSGLLTGTAPGTVTVSARAQDGSGVSGSMDMIIEPLPAELTALTENLAAELQPLLETGTYEYALAAAHGEDSVQITAELASGTIKYSYATTVDGAVYGKEVASGIPETIHLDVGENIVTIETEKEDCETVTYTVAVRRAASSSKEITGFVFEAFDPQVVGVITGREIVVIVPPETDSVSSLEPTISHTGKSISPASGVATDFTAPVTYTVTADDGSTQAYTITVVVEVKGAEISVAQLLQIGEITSATASTTEPGATGWTSSNETVATIGTESGEITALAAGTTTIAYNDSDSGNINELAITVYPGATVDNPDIGELRVEGPSVTPTSFTGPATGETIAWSSSDETKATVNETTGVISATAEGDTRISYVVTEDDTGIVIAKGHFDITVLPEGEFWTGSGTEADPWVITKPKHLNNVRRYIGYDNKDKCFALGNDIDLGEYLGVEGAEYNGGEGWRPLGPAATTAFYGKFDGNGFDIINLAIDRPTTNYQSLFGYVHTLAEIRNLGLVGVQVTGSEFIGALAGYIHSGAGTGAQVTDCYVTGSVSGGRSTGGLIGYAGGSSSTSGCHSSATVSGSGQYAGGLVGENDGSIVDSYNTGSVSNTDHHTGGLVGTNFGAVNACYSTGNVTSTGVNTGGLVGQAYEGTVSASFSTGTVQANLQRTGGLVGYLYESEVSDCYSTSNVTGGAGGTQYTGGLVGYLYNSTITNSFSTGTVSGAASLGGLAAGVSTSGATSSYWDTEASGIGSSACGEGKATSDMQQQDTFVDWDFVSTWSIDGEEHGGYPFLRWQCGE